MKKILTLYYHRVTEYDRDINLLAVTPDNFRRQIMWLKDNYQIIRAEDSWTDKNGEAVCITFDDGYVDNLVNAVPILEELQIPATIFVSTQRIRNKEQVWWNELENLLLDDGDYPDEFTFDDEFYGCTWRTDSYKKRENCYYSLHFLMKNYLDYKTRESAIAQLEMWNGKRTYRNYIVNQTQCAALSEFSCITIGAHTVTHPSLKSISVKDQEFEIIESIKDIEKITGNKVSLFSYPFGTPNIDYDERTINILKKTEIKKAFTTGYALWDDNCNMYEIPRLVVRDLELKGFINYIGELWHI